MSESELQRACQSIASIHADTELADADELLIGVYTSFTVFIPANSSITSLAVYAAPEIGGTYLPLYDSDKNAVAMTGLVSGRAYQLKFATFAVKAIKFVSDADGDVTLTMKS